MNTPPALFTDRLGKRYGSRWALRDCNLEIPAGTVTALVGPNGAGKTTLLQLAVGLSRPSAGEVHVLGHSPRRDATAVLPRLGFLAQDHPLYKAASVAALHTLRDTVIPPIARTLPDVEVAVTGVTAGTYDFNHQMRARLPYVFLFVLGLAFALLLLTFRSLVIATTAVALNLLSVGAAYGILVAVFQHGWLAGVFGFQTNGAIVSWLPLFLFVVLFGLSMDYHVFILNRIKELHDAGASTDEAIRLAITRTAGTVTSAAIIMVVLWRAMRRRRSFPQARRGSARMPLAAPAVMVQTWQRWPGSGLARHGGLLAAAGPALPSRSASPALRPSRPVAGQSPSVPAFSGPAGALPSTPPRPPSVQGTSICRRRSFASTPTDSGPSASRRRCSSRRMHGTSALAHRPCTCCSRRWRRDGWSGSRSTSPRVCSTSTAS